MNLPNTLTMFRLLVIPFFLLAATIKFHYSDYIAAAIFLAGAVTDGLDGYLARKNGMITVFGKFMDPLADKILVSTALIILVEMGRVPGWAAVIIIGRELAVTGLRAVASTEGVIISASLLGKIKTVTQIIAIIIIFIKCYPFTGKAVLLGNFIMGAVVAITIWSGLDYYFKTMRILR